MKLVRALTFPLWMGLGLVTWIIILPIAALGRFAKGLAEMGRAATEEAYDYLKRRKKP